MEVSRQGGASSHGNFHQYYEFHPVHERLKFIPEDLALKTRQIGRKKTRSIQHASSDDNLIDIELSPPSLSREITGNLDEKAAPRDPSEVDSADHEPAKQDGPKRWWQKRTVRFLIYRLIIRLCAIGLIVYLSTLIDFGSIINAYLDWIDGFDTFVAALIFIAVLTPFAAFAPGSYAPTVIAGITFGFFIGFPISYIIMNLAAMLNLVTVRRCLRPCVQRTFGKRLDTYKGLARLIATRPLTTVIIMRLPYLGSGILHYFFSLSEINVLVYAKANAAGFLPGAILFSSLGTQIRTFVALVQGDTSTSSIVVFSIITTFIIMAIAGLVTLTRSMTKKALAEQKANDVELEDVDNSMFTVLDVGCNEGDLTLALVEHLYQGQVEAKQSVAVRAVGVDIDSELVERANKKVDSLPDNCSIEFLEGDLTQELTQSAVKDAVPLVDGRFDLVCCFSVSMWIHLHHGDDGLKDFLRFVTKSANRIIMEPQPWKCYKTCRRRWRKAEQSLPHEWESYQLRNTVDQFIIDFIVEQGFELQKLGVTKWGRQLVLLTRA